MGRQDWMRWLGLYRDESGAVRAGRTPWVDWDVVPPEDDPRWQVRLMRVLGLAYYPDKTARRPFVGRRMPDPVVYRPRRRQAGDVQEPPRGRG